MGDATSDEQTTAARTQRIPLPLVRQTRHRVSCVTLPANIWQKQMIRVRVGNTG